MRMIQSFPMAAGMVVMAITILGIETRGQDRTGPSRANALNQYLQVRDLTADSAKGELRFSVTNTGTKVITAFALHTKTAFTSVPFDPDFFGSIGLELEGATLPNGQRNALWGGIRPGETEAYTITGESNPDIMVTAIVFADDTASGDEGDIAHIFKRRSARASELSLWCGDLKTLRVLTSSALERGARDLAEKIKGAPDFGKRRVGAQIIDQEFLSYAGLERQELLSDLSEIGKAPAFDGQRINAMVRHCESGVAHSSRKGGPLQ